MKVYRFDVNEKLKGSRKYLALTKLFHSFIVSYSWYQKFRESVSQLYRPILGEALTWKGEREKGYANEMAA